MKTTYTFRYTTHSPSGQELQDIEHVVSTEDFLPEVLYHFKSFLQGVGYNYVSNVYAEKNNGEKVGEE